MTHAARTEAYWRQASGGPRLVRTEKETSDGFSLDGIKTTAERTSTGAGATELATVTSGVRTVAQTAQSSAR